MYCHLIGCLSVTHSKWLHKYDIPGYDWPIADFPVLKYPAEKYERENRESNAESLRQVVSGIFACRVNHLQM